MSAATEPAPVRQGVAVVGLGSMGRRIAATLARAGFEVIGWNRTPRDFADLGAVGVRAVRDVSAAVRGAAVVLAVPLEYAHTRAALSGPARAGDLTGATLLNFSYGTVTEAREMQAWAQAAGMDYLDGNLLCYPDEVGSEAGRCVLSGSSTAHAATRDLVAAIGPGDYLGPDVAASSAVGSAVGVVFYHAALAAFYESLAFVARFGVAPRQVLPHLQAMLDLLSSHFVSDIDRVEQREYDQPSASIAVHLAGVRIAAHDLAVLGQPSPLMRGFEELVQPLVDAGAGEQSIALLYDHLLQKAGAP